jgi:hypothetical protein
LKWRRKEMKWFAIVSGFISGALMMMGVSYWVDRHQKITAVIHFLIGMGWLILVIIKA